MSPYEKAWQAVQSRIAAAAVASGRDPHLIRLLAVTKSWPTEAVRTAYDAGQRAFGENYVQEAATKIGALAGLRDIEWHLIGPLQGNKAKIAAAQFAWVETVDRLTIAERLSMTRDERLPPLCVCIQVNISGEASKSGVAPDGALQLAHAVSRLPRLALRGFMGIAAPTADSDAQRGQFRKLKAIYDRGRMEGLVLDTLSMGMSADLEAAIAEGATLVRVGSALFGSRS